MGVGHRYNSFLTRLAQLTDIPVTHLLIEHFGTKADENCYSPLFDTIHFLLVWHNIPTDVTRLLFEQFLNKNRRKFRVIF